MELSSVSFYIARGPKFSFMEMTAFENKAIDIALSWKF